MNYITYLLKQSHREDPIGDLARDVRDDIRKGFLGVEGSIHEDILPQLSSNIYKDWRDYLMHRGACDEALEALRESFSEHICECMRELNEARND